jgi:hypothetical protein
MTPPTCGYCGRPIIGLITWGYGVPYHHDCARGPCDPPTFSPPPLTEDAVRRIVREELDKEI